MNTGFWFLAVNC